MKRIYIFLLCAVSILACKKSVLEPESLEIGKDYYPFSTGKYLVYNVDSLIYRDFYKDSVRKFMQIKHEIDSSFMDLQNRLSYKINTYLRPDSNSTWQFVRADYATITDFTIELQENSNRLIKFAFPVRDNYTWDGNKYIDVQTIEWMQDWRLKYFDFQKPYTVGNNTYPSTVTVKYMSENLPYKKTNDTLTDPYYAFVSLNEVYAKDIGLIYKSLVSFKRDNSVDKDATRSGFRTTYRLIEHN